MWVATHYDWSDPQCHIPTDNRPNAMKLLARLRRHWLVRRHRRFLRASSRSLPAKIDAVVFDFDGVFTDNRVAIDQDGRESATASRGDGMGIGRLKKTGLPLLVISKEPVPIVVHRCGKLGLECLHGVDDKLPLLEAWLGERGLDLKQSVYMGNDVNDLECLRAAGCGVVPSDAHPDAVEAADLLLDLPGGHGAVRQLCDLVCWHHGRGSTSTN